MNAPWKNEKVKMAYEKPELRASIEIILSVFAVSFLVMFAIRPTLETVATLQKKIDDQNLVDRKLTSKIAQLSKAKDNLATFADSLELYDFAVPDQQGQNEVLRRLALLANENEVNIRVLSLTAVPLIGNEKSLSDKTRGKTIPSDTKPFTTSGVEYFEVNLDVSGKQDKLFNLLEKIESMDRVAIIKNLAIKKKSTTDVSLSKNEDGTLRLSGRLLFYYLQK